MTSTSDMQKLSTTPQSITAELVEELSDRDIEDLCDAAEASIVDGGGFGWLEPPPRDSMERFWQGVLVVPERLLVVARLDGVICGSVQMILPSRHNEAQKGMVQLLAGFTAPWARRYGVAQKLLEKAEDVALAKGFAVINLDVRQTHHAAIKLYEKMGYQNWGTNPNYAWVDEKMIAGCYYSKVIDPSKLQKNKS